MSDAVDKAIREIRATRAHIFDLNHEQCCEVLLKLCTRVRNATAEDADGVAAERWLEHNGDYIPGVSPSDVEYKRVPP